MVAPFGVASFPRCFTGRDTAWNGPSDTNLALPPGSYALEVRATGTHGAPFEVVASIPVVLLP